MTRSKNTKKALLASMLSLLLCVAMLIGSTFAWFTDSVTSGNNRIMAGNLDVELWHNSASVKTDTEVNGDTKLFLDADGSSIKWEPGVIAYENFTVKNAGSLALKYSLSLNVSGQNFTTEGHSLDEVIGVAFYEGQFTGDRTVAQALDYGKLESTTKLGKILPGGDDDDQFAAVLYWKPGENDNWYNLKNGLSTEDGLPLSLDLGIDLQATQTPYESDSFDEKYDDGLMAQPLDASVSGELTVKQNEGSQEYYHVGNETVSVDIPTEDVGSSVEKVYLVVETKTVTESFYDLDISLEDQDHEPIAEASGAKMYRVKVNIGAGKTDVVVTHNTEKMKQGGNWNTEGYDYDDVTGILTLYVSHFSPFEITWHTPTSLVGHDAFREAITAASTQMGASFELYQADAIVFSSWDKKETDVQKIKSGVTWEEGVDVTADKDGSVRLFAVSNRTKKSVFVLTATEKEKIYFPENSSEYFCYGDHIPTYYDGKLYYISPSISQYAPTVFTFESNVNTSRVTNMKRMFNGQFNCHGITGLQYFDTSNVTDMSEMFYGVSQSSFSTDTYELTLDVSSFDTSKVTTMYRMFGSMTGGSPMKCSLKKVITGEKFDTSKVTNMKEMFVRREDLSTITVAKDWDTSAVTEDKDMFDDCKVLQGGQGTAYATAKVTDHTYAHIDGGDANPGYFTQKAD